MTRQWHAVRIRAGAEAKALVGIEKAGMAGFLPVELIRKKFRMKHPMLSWRPLFPRYLFVELDPARDISKLAEIEGIECIMRPAGRLSPIDPEKIAAIRRAEQLGMFDMAKTRLADGDTVRLPDGPFAALMWKIKTCQRHRRMELVGDFPFRFTAAVDKLEKISA